MNTTTSPASTSPLTSAGGITSGGIPAGQVNPPSLAGAYTPDSITVMRAISAYSDWLFAHPNPALLANHMLPSSRNYAGVKAELTTLQTNGWHARPSVSEIVWIESQGPFAHGVGLVNGHPSYVGTGIKVVNRPHTPIFRRLECGGTSRFLIPQPSPTDVGRRFGSGVRRSIPNLGHLRIQSPDGLAAFES
jgi:hypothetical protein